MKRFTIAATGASGAIYFERTVRALLAGGCHVDLVVSNYGKVTLQQETDYPGGSTTVEDWLRGKYEGSLEVHAVGDQAARIASGSAKSHGMVVVPCTMKTLGSMANGIASNLIERAADVTLKERRPLVVVVREAPYNLIHLENMTKLARAGASILPASPAFYQRPQTFDDLGDFIAQRALSLLGVDVDLFEAWQGRASLED